MKKFILACLSALITIGATAQKTGTVTYEVKLKGGDGQMAQLAPIINGIGFTIQYLGTQTKLDMSIMGGMLGRMQVIGNAKDKKNFMLLDLPMAGEKSLIRLDSASLAKSQANAVDSSANNAELKEMMAKQKGMKPSIKYVRGKKKIAGHRCKKAEMDFMGQKATVYYSKKIKPEGVTSLFKDMKGLPLSFELNLMGIELSIIAKEISTAEVDKSTFDEPSDYKEMSPQEFQDKLKGLKNGGGIGM